MTPNNLVNMAYIKGLELIALSDHNSAKNLPAAKAVADARGLLFVPALEVESREEVHVLCYLPDVDTALAEWRAACEPALRLMKDEYIDE